MLYNTDDLRISSLRPLLPPAILMEEVPITAHAAKVITHARNTASAIIQGNDDRLLVIVGPCSIHDPPAAIDYAHLLKHAIEQYQDDLAIIMRVYFEKPRTTIGWKGLINDPLLDGTFNINQGLRTARQLLRELNNMGVPAATEFLDCIIPQFISDLVSWGAIGARTTESQIHRELASGLSMPVGFKNGTEGNVQIAMDALSSAQHPHHFLSVTKQGIAAIVSTAGNHDCHIILRGAQAFTNYETTHVSEVNYTLIDKQLNPRLMIDCSHGNSNKDHTRQAIVANDICQQLINGTTAIIGVMLESNIVAGKQPLTQKNKLKYGQSITDACIDWKETEAILEKLAAAVRERRHARK